MKDDRKPSAASAALSRYISEHGVAELAATVRVAKMTVYKWGWGDQRPADKRRKPIEAATGGAVRAGDWCEDIGMAVAA